MRLRLAKLTRIADAADALATQALEDKRAQRSLEKAIAEASDARLAEAAGHEERARDAETAARSNAAAAEADDPWPPERGARDLLDALSEGLDELVLLIEAAGAAELTSEAERLRFRQQALQERTKLSE